MATDELEKIIDNMDTVFRGDAWHGPSLMEIVNSLPDSVVAVPHSFSDQTIAQLIYHLTAYRRFVIHKLNDDIGFTLETDEENYGKPEQTTRENWTNLKMELVATHKAMLELLETKDNSLLEKRVPGEYYDFYKLLTGLIQHDTYHLGMIWVLWT